MNNLITNLSTIILPTLSWENGATDFEAEGGAEHGHLGILTEALSPGGGSFLRRVIGDSARRECHFNPSRRARAKVDFAGQAQKVEHGPRKANQAAQGGDGVQRATSHWQYSLVWEQRRFTWGWTAA